MKVLVIGMNGLGLAPTTPGKARRLLKDKRATVVCRQPFTIRLKYKTGCAHPELTLGENTGSQHIGFAIVEKLSEDSGRVLDKAEYRLRPTMEKRALLEKRATYRRGRRYRMTVQLSNSSCIMLTSRAKGHQIILSAWQLSVINATHLLPISLEVSCINGCCQESGFRGDTVIQLS